MQIDSVCLHLLNNIEINGIMIENKVILDTSKKIMFTWQIKVIVKWLFKWDTGQKVSKEKLI